MANGNYGDRGGGNRDRNQRRGHTQATRIEKLNIKWITGEEPMGVAMVDWANAVGKILNEGRDALTTSQIRKFYGEVKRIHADFDKHREDVPMLNAKLAYAVGRNKGKGRIMDFAKIFEEAIKKGSKSAENFDRLVKILEATVAYHKFYGGRD